MRIWDCHSHCRGDEKGDDVLRAMDQAGITRINLFAPYPRPRDGVFYREDVRASIDHVAQVQAADPDRIFGLVWAEPRAPGMVEEIEYGIVERGLRGVKMIPDHWSAGDEMLFPIYEKMRALGKPIQFHSGILYGFGDSSQYCRPVLYEALVHFPGLKFSLAHVGWPWIDECIAVFGRFRAAAGYKLERCQMWIDTCRGTPDAWREEALRKAIPFCTMERVMFGVDGHPASLPEYGREHIQKDLALLRNVIGVSQEQIETFFWGACERFYAE
ncbi:MAG: amidohydrolase [Armatimonadetes bacterium]|jgi:predicted TIM-barrel fold metal-dependent hydrolase|nr:amidohydrolase [Armatimonadota bacterium]